MEEVNITSWRELTLLQLGALLKDCTVDKHGRLYKEWFILKDNIDQAELIYHTKTKPSNNEKPSFLINSTKTLVAYFFTFSALVHKRFLYPNKNIGLQEIIKEYHLDILTQFGKNYNFVACFRKIIPHRIADLEKINQDKLNFNDSKSTEDNWICRTDEECVTLCWSRILNYLKENDAPTPDTTLLDAFTWLEEKNKQAYMTVTVPTSVTENHLFDYRYERPMTESYPRFLQQLDDWNPYCMKIWSAFQKKGRLRLRELSAVLNITPDRTEGGNHHA